MRPVDETYKLLATHQTINHTETHSKCMCTGLFYCCIIGFNTALIPQAVPWFPSCSLFSNDTSFLRNCVNGISFLTLIRNLPSSLTLRVTLLSKHLDVLGFFFSFLFQNGNGNQLISRQEIQALTILHLCQSEWISFTSQLCWPRDTTPPTVCCLMTTLPPMLVTFQIGFFIERKSELGIKILCLFSWDKQSRK